MSKLRSEAAQAVAELAESSVNLVVRPWCAGPAYWDVRFDLMQAIKVGLEGAGYSIPFPQRDLHIVSGGLSASGAGQ